MKHQYFGDVNDYRKYGLLRRLSTDSGLRLGVCWMLTPDDSRSDGKFVDYLEKPALWRRHDPDLFDRLTVAVRAGRHIDRVRQHAILEKVPYVDAVVPDRVLERRSFFERAHCALAAADLVFFDPDNGIEVPSCPIGRKKSSKYVMKTELATTFGGGQSVLIYQHFVREERTAFLRRLSSELRDLTGCTTVHCFRTANVAFLLLPQDCHRTAIGAVTANIERQWAGQIEVSTYL